MTVDKAAQVALDESRKEPMVKRWIKIKCYFGWNDWEEKNLSEIFYSYKQCKECPATNGLERAQREKKYVEVKEREYKNECRTRILQDKLERFLDSQQL